MLRILSDLHFRDASSRLRRLEDLQPLLEGVDELWLNGDTCDNQSGLNPEEVAKISAFFHERVPRVRFLTGNHDPDISSEHQATTASGRLWAFHGDALFPNVVPWSRVRDQLAARVDSIRAAHPERDFESFEGRMACLREACTGFQRECDPARRDVPHRLRRAWTEFFPPRQPWAMLQAWRTMADRVADVAPRWQPQARVIATGHIHFPHVWQRGELTIINTGAFSGPLGAATVEWEGEVVKVRRLQQHQGAWHAGSLMREIPLAAPQPLPASSTP
jgi:predicted phosphodiesterase